MQLVMFDIDGTLTESNALDNKSYLQALSEVFGFSEVSSDWTSYSHATDACILREVCQRNIPYAFSDDDESREGITAIALARAEKHYGRSFQNIVYIGDGIWDIRSAQKSGYAFIGIASGDRAEELFSAGATHVFSSYDDSESFLAALATAA
jgi:phosphoglycolate phosphatase-like HAD superfamily hydrolase